MLSRQFLAKAKRTAKRLASPIFPNQLRCALDEAITGGSEILYVHSGLSNCGHFLPGPTTVVEVLQEFCDTLFHPTHTYSYPPSPEAPAPVFDAKTTPSEMGLLAETFWRQPGVVRSIHSTHSLAAAGALADQICANHYECDSPCGAGTPYSQLVHRGASALMFGVSFRYYTPFHTAECEAGSSMAFEPGCTDRLRFVDENSTLQERLSKRQNRTSPRFHEAGILLEERGFVRRVRLGRSDLLFVPDMSEVHDFLVRRLKKIPDFLRSTCRHELT